VPNAIPHPEPSGQAEPAPSGQSAALTPAKAGLVRRWCAWPAIALERLPWPYPVSVALLTLLAVGEQILEYALEQGATGGQPPMSPLRLAVFPILVAYILIHLGILKRAAVEALAELRPTVLVGDEEYEGRVRSMVAASPRVELGLMVASLALVLVLFAVLRADLLNTNRSLPASVPAAAFIVAMYALLGWLLLTVVYTSLRHARGLYALAHRPLTINVFDPASLLPFGWLGLIQSLPLVGIVLVPLILFGPPTGGGYLVIGVSAVSFLALFVPLWGVHAQIDRAHERALADIYGQIERIRDILFQGVDADVPNLAALADRTALLMNLRKVIQETPNWPFRDSAAVARAIVAVTSPLVYVVLTELIRTYVFPLLRLGGTP
jgi:hypothetical protein